MVQLAIRTAAPHLRPSDPAGGAPVAERLQRALEMDNCAVIALLQGPPY